MSIYFTNIIPTYFLMLNYLLLFDRRDIYHYS